MFVPEYCSKDWQYEKKFLNNELELQAVESIVKTNTALFNEIYYKRQINNVYFDSSALNAYEDNVQGNPERVKLRVRWYGPMLGKTKPVLEIKIKNGALRSKLLFPLTQCNITQKFCWLDYLKQQDLPDWLMNEIKVMLPVLLNSYERKYFLSADKRYRLTLDNAMQYYNKQSKEKQDGVILELKYNMDADNEVDQVTNEFSFRLTKSSKYVTGIELLGI